VRRWWSVYEQEELGWVREQSRAYESGLLGEVKLVELTELEVFEVEEEDLQEG
jgi:hypothetical protein